MKRREFLASASAAAALMQSKQSHARQAAGPSSAAPSMGSESNSRQAASRIPRVTRPGTMKGEMLYRDLGATGEQVSVIGTSHFDTTARHPDWLGLDSPEVQKLSPQLSG